MARAGYAWTQWGRGINTRVQAYPAFRLCAGVSLAGDRVDLCSGSAVVSYGCRLELSLSVIDRALLIREGF